MRSNQFKGTVAFAALAIILSARAETRVVETVEEFKEALAYMNGRHSQSDTIVLKAGRYAVDSLNEPYYNGATGVKAIVPSNANFGFSYFTIRGETDDPRDTVLYRETPETESDIRFSYNYAGKIQNLTISNVTLRAETTGACGAVNVNGVYSNVVVTCCSAPSAAVAGSGAYYDCAFIDNHATTGRGGVAATSSPKFYGCLFERNTAATDGGAIYNTFLSNCVFRANTAGQYGGAVYGGGVVCGLVDCVVISNQATYGGGIANTFATNCLIACNTAAREGGGVYCTSSSYGVVYGGCVSNNVATCEGKNGDSGGGGTCLTRAVNARICMNRIVDNRAKEYAASKYNYARGGGMWKGSAVNCRIDGNAIVNAMTTAIGAGSSGVALTNCVICNNFFPAGLGSGIESGSANGCIISNNASASSSHMVRQMGTGGLYNCIVHGGTLDMQSFAVNCRFEAATGTCVIAEGANVHTSGTFTIAGTLFPSRAYCTNCLFTGNSIYTMFAPSSDKDTILSNCTIADNRFERFTGDSFNTAEMRFILQNCLFARNRRSSNSAPRDFYSIAPEIHVSNTLFSVAPELGAAVKEKVLSQWANVYTNDMVRFTETDPVHPYAIGWRSFARGKGLVQDWMAEATDIRCDPQFPRLREGLCDLGCYQCWEPRPGITILLR